MDANETPKKERESYTEVLHKKHLKENNILASAAKRAGKTIEQASAYFKVANL